MKFPSVKALAQSATATIKRFPFEIVFALAGTIASTINIQRDWNYDATYNWCIRVMMMANLGVLLNLAATLFLGSRSLSVTQRAAIRGTAVAISIGLLFAIDPARGSADVTRFFLLSLAFHLLVAFAAFTVPGHIQGFWQFNKTLFLRFLTSALYSAVLFLGIAAAIGATHFLFNTEATGKIFANLFTWIAGIFNTLFFLSGVPQDTRALDKDESYPKGLKIFTQYVLIPLATIYVAILLAYEVKIVALWVLPKGLVSSLILGYAVFGILSLLLVYPVRNREENKWLSTYAKSFYFLLIPLLLLLFVAVGARVSKYGITEMRYFLLALAVWLAGITFYFLLSKKQNIKLIPISLCLFTLLAAYGAQSAFSVSEYSQRTRLAKLFEKNGRAKDGILLPFDDTKANKADGEQAAQIVSYLVEKHSLSSLQPFFKQPLATVSDSITLKVTKKGDDYFSKYELLSRKTNWALTKLGLKKYNEYYARGLDGDDDDEKEYQFKSQNRNLLSVKDQDFVITQDYGTSDTLSYNIDGIYIKQFPPTDDVYALKIGAGIFKFDVNTYLKSKLPQMIKYADSTRKYVTQTVPDSLLIMTTQSAKYKVQLRIKYVNIRTSGKEVNLGSIDVVYLIRKEQ